MVQIETDKSFDGSGEGRAAQPRSGSTGGERPLWSGGGIDAAGAVHQPESRPKLRFRDARTHPRVGAAAAARLHPDAYQRITTLAERLRGDARAIQIPLTPKWPRRQGEAPKPGEPPMKATSSDRSAASAPDQVNIGDMAGSPFFMAD